MRVPTCVAVLTTVSLLTAPGRAQSPAAPATFETASVKPSTDDLRTGIVVDPGRFAAVGVTLADLMRYAYGFNALTSQSQVVGGPPWIVTARFDIVAISRGQPTLEMLKALLEDRFNVMAHVESRDAATYELLVDRRDGRLGPAIHQTTSACEGAGVPLPPTSSGATRRCGISGRPGSYAGEGTSLAQVARMLGNFPAVGRLVVDRTGLTAAYDWTLEWTPSFTASPNGGGSPVADPRAEAGVSLFTALRDQLGLKLEAARSAIDVLVVDRAERPGPD